MSACPAAPPTTSRTRPAHSRQTAACKPWSMRRSWSQVVVKLSHEQVRRRLSLLSDRLVAIKQDELEVRVGEQVDLTVDRVAARPLDRQVLLKTLERQRGHHALHGQDAEA